MSYKWESVVGYIPYLDEIIMLNVSDRGFVNQLEGELEECLRYIDDHGLRNVFFTDKGTIDLLLESMEYRIVKNGQISAKRYPLIRLE